MRRLALAIATVTTVAVLGSADIHAQTWERHNGVQFNCLSLQDPCRSGNERFWVKASFDGGFFSARWGYEDGTGGPNGVSIRRM